MKWVAGMRKYRKRMGNGQVTGGEFIVWSRNNRKVSDDVLISDSPCSGALGLPRFT